ncbi:unknown [Crocosphaera subtropica ATCC 51142]|uniref:Methyltransferase FkbM domain-containing protein n=2 Tax=Crocosphaera TaxID=263510 RepID=B1X187_CROS5|nr:unknown [Crocosphaera subtropica ATCC 51142]
MNQTMAIKDYLINKLRRVLGIIDILAALDQVLKDQKRELIKEILNQIKPGSIVECCINDVELLAPIEPLQVYQHCVFPNAEQKLNFLIENHCAEWLCSHINYGDTVLDIGAAFGVISFPLAKAVGKKGHIYAFEPAKNTQDTLQKILSLNHISNITVVTQAISDKSGIAEFIEYSQDNESSWASDTSTLASDNNIDEYKKFTTYQVSVITLDEYIAKNAIEPSAIKMDIEGFEFYALQGGKQTLEKYLPYLCIDIHADVKTGKSSLVEIEPFLQSLGYSLTMEEHTLYGIPPEKT